MDDKDNMNKGGGNPDQESDSEIKIWKRTPKTRKKTYIYEVPHETEPESETPEETIWGADKEKNSQEHKDKIQVVDFKSDTGEEEIKLWKPDAASKTGDKVRGMAAASDAGDNVRGVGAASDAGDNVRGVGAASDAGDKDRSSNKNRSQKSYKAIHFDEEAEESDKEADRAAREKALRERLEREKAGASDSVDPKAGELSDPEEEHLSRRDRKKRWRGRVIQGSEGSVSGGKRLLRSIRRNRARIVLLILVLAAVIGGGMFFNRVRTYKKFSVDWQVSATDTGYSDYTAFGDVILHYSQDGISASDTDGNLLWNQAYNMDVPAVAIRDDYVVVYDVKGKDFYICDSEGCTGHGSTDKKILKGEISASGVVALVLDDKKANYIEYYRKDGSQIDVEIKTLITGDGYPLDIAVSPDGEQLMTSYIYASDNKMLSEVVFRNFEVGKNEADRVVGGFKDYEESLVPDVLFFDDDSSAAVTDHSVDFYSTSNALKPERVCTQKFDSEIKSVATSDTYVAVILKNDGSEDTSEETASETGSEAESETASEETTAEETEASDSGYLLEVFDQDGKKVFDDNIDFEYTKINFTGDGLVVYNSMTCAVYNMTGVKKFEGSFNVEIEGVMRFGEKTLIVHGNGALQKITLK